MIFTLTGCEVDEENAYHDNEKYNITMMKAFRKQINEAKNKEQDLTLPYGMTFEILKNDLLKQRKLIPFRGVLGGTPQYLEDSVLFFNDHAFVWAEDGHIGAGMVLSYTISEKNKITWTLVAYDKGEYEHELE